MRLMRPIQLMKIAVLVGVMLMISPQARAESDQAGINASSIEDGQSLKTHNLSFAVSVDSVLHNIKRKKDVHLIDVRGSREFDAVHIPGSINIPLYLIKAKPFLKTGRLVLVDNGYLYGLLADECEKLAENGFHVSILWGGLNAWKEKGMDFEGDMFAVRQFGRVSSRDVFLEKYFKERTIINVAPEHSSLSAQLFPEARHAPDLTGDLLIEIAAEKAPAVFSSILIFNENGMGYDAMEDIVNKAGVGNVFYLTGGLDAYAGFLRNIALSNAPPETRARSVGNCGP